MPVPKKEAGFNKVGNYFTCNSTTNAKNVGQLVTSLIKSFTEDNKKQMVWILTGTHGTKQGELVKERKFFWKEDKQLEGQYIKAVDVFKFTKWTKTEYEIGKNSWKKYLGKKGLVIFAWCFSEQSRKGWMKNEKLV